MPKHQKHISHPQGQSGQGEHIFNALGDMVTKIAIQAEGYTETSLVGEKKDAAVAQLAALKLKVTNFNLARDNMDFRSANDGDDRNSKDFSSFREKTEKAMLELFQSSDKEMGDYISKLQLLKSSDLKKVAIDKVAYQSKLEELPVSRHAAFIGWYRSTEALMEPTYLALIQYIYRVRKTYSIP